MGTRKRGNQTGRPEKEEHSGKKSQDSDVRLARKSGVSLQLATSILILLIAVTGGIYFYNFGDMSKALETFETRLAKIIAPSSTTGPQQQDITEPSTKSPSNNLGSTEKPPSLKHTQDTTEKKKAPYSKKAITNKYDNKIRGLLDDADDQLEKGRLRDSLLAYDQLLERYPHSGRARYGRAQVLDKMSQEQRSNSLLEQCIEEYTKVLSVTDAPKELLVLAGKRCADRQTFRGWSSKAVQTMASLVKRYPRDTSLRNSLGVAHLMSGQNADAKLVFKGTLDINPDDGNALVHYGFILKATEGRMQESIHYLQKGIDTGDEGTMDGRFIFHLGDAYYREGHHNKSYDVYKLGANNGLFKSYWQRSLYNVDRLSAHGWWTMEQTNVKAQLEILKKNWRTIRDEGMAQLDSKGAFLNEDENLRSMGDWKQLTLYSRGRKSKEACALAPKTCALIDKFPEAGRCKRGQVKFSVMHPGTHVWPHCGPTNCRIRAHLGLEVPDGPRIRVADETKTWKEGEFIIFDDSFEHEVWHDGDKLRLVLIVDVWHPELTQHERETMSPI